MLELAVRSGRRCSASLAAPEIVGAARARFRADLAELPGGRFPRYGHPPLRARRSRRSLGRPILSGRCAPSAAARGLDAHAVATLQVPRALAGQPVLGAIG